MDMDDSLHSPASLSSAAELAREERRKKGRVRHAPHQTAALNEVFQRTDHPSLQERQALAKQLGMETKVVNSWFQNKRAAIRKRVERQSSQPPPLVVRKGAPVAVKEEVVELAPRSQHPSLPPISSLLRPPPHSGSVGGDSEYEDDDERLVHLPPIQDGPRISSPFFDPVRQAVSSQSLRSVSATYAPSRSFGIPHKRSLDEAELPSRASLPPPSAFHPSLRSNYLSPASPWSRLPDLQLDTISGRSVSGFPDTASERSRTPSSVYGDELIHRSLPPLSQLSRMDDDATYSEKRDRLSVDTSADGLLPQPSIANIYKIRSRPTSFQAEELRKLYEANSHPTREDKQRLAEVTGLRMQSITNWFQNQRSTAKRRRGGDSLETASLYSRDSPLPSPSDIALRNARIVSGGVRPRRSRPEPFQLEALKKLYEQTRSPSIEQRGALALEVGMEVSKVTNWFRNLRQTAKKRARTAAAFTGQGVEADDDEFDMDAEDEACAGSIGSMDSRGPSVAVFSRGATPVAAAGSPAYTEVDELMDDVDDPEPVRSAEHMDVEEHGSNSHETGSDEEEAVTPSPRVSARDLPFIPSTPSVDPVVPKPPTSAERANNSVSVEDAVLLLGLRNRSSPQ